MWKLLVIVFVIGFAGLDLTAQSIVEAPEVTQLMQRFEQHNRLHQKVRGWRVQVFVTTDRRQIENEKEKYAELLPGYPVEFSHEDAFYHLKSGAFLSQNAALPFLREIREEFPGAFVVADEIDVSEVLTYR